MPKINIVLDATMLDTFTACPKKFHYRFNMNKVTPQTARPLDRGTVIHTGFETYYKALQAHKPFEVALNDALVSVRLALTQSDLNSPDGERCLDVIEESIVFWKQDDASWVINAVEKPFMFVLHETEEYKLIMIGKIDLLRSNNKYDNVPMDHKSYERDFPLTRLTNQFQCYAYATQSNYLFVNRVGFQQNMKLSSGQDKHRRIPLSYDSLILEQWKQNTIRWAEYYLDCCIDNNWPMNTTSCDKYNRLCEYFHICDTSGEVNKIHKLEVDFKQTEPWDVSKTLSTKG